MKFVYRRFLPVFLALTLGIACFPAHAFAEEETIPGTAPAETAPAETTPSEETLPTEETIPAAFSLLYTGEAIPGGVLIFSTEPVLEDIRYSVCTDGGEWLVLEGNSYPIPDGEPGTHILSVTAAREEQTAENTLEFSYTIAPSEAAPQETEPDGTQPAGLKTASPQPLGPGLYFGQLHAHTTLSDGTVSVEEAFQTAAGTEGLAFFAVTDHSDSFDNADLGQIGADACAVSQDWAEGKAAAEAVTDGSFVGIFGYEMSWPARMQAGHISTFSTPGFQSWEQADYRTYDSALENYYAALASVPGAIGQFNHPGTQYGAFGNFGHYSEAADKVMTLLEVEGGNYEYYTKALDQGWHVAPSSGSASRDGHPCRGRTVVYADSLTEDGIYDALRACRAYATEDADLEILYTLDGHFMGSMLEQRHIGEAADISVTLRDPSDSAVGLVEVITEGGEILGSQTLSASSGTLTFSLRPEYGYYWLRITQPDGDSAATAPVWLEAAEELGIAGLTCETAVPVQGGAVTLKLELYNRESADFLVDSLEILADGQTVSSDKSLTQIPGGSSLTHALSFVCGCVGQTKITVKLTGTLEGSPRTYQASLNLSFRQSDQVTGIVVDGSHGNAGLDQLTILTKLAAAEDIRVTAADEGITAEMLENCRFLLVSAPSEPFSQEFIDASAEFASYGGSVILCGQGDTLDRGIHSAFQLNRILSALGSTLRLQDDLARDAVNNGGESTELYLDDINTASPWCETVSKNQVYRMVSGCTVDPGSGVSLVRGYGTTDSIDGDRDGLGSTEPGGVTVLACEDLLSGGTVFAAGSLFLSDDDTAEPDNIWGEPYANRTILQNLLDIGGETLDLSTIQDARTAEDDTLLRIRGYVTAGTANPYNTFPDTIFLQDDTGGILVTPFTAEDIRVGTPVEITGYAADMGGNRSLKPVSFKILDAALYQYTPRRGSWDTLLDIARNGGRLVEVEGECLETFCREDGTLTGFTLKDADGNSARIRIEDCIFSGSSGKNELHKDVRKGRAIQAMGLLYADEYGDTVIRVRNCEEVVYVPPRTYLNPKTGDSLLFFTMAMTASAAGLLLLRKKRR